MSLRNGCETVLANSGNRTATNTSANFSRGQNNRGIKFIIDITTASGFSLTFGINYYDPVSTKTILAKLVSAAKTTAGTFELTIYPGMPVTANVSANDVMPSGYSVTVTHSDATPVAYSVSAHLIP